MQPSHDASSPAIDTVADLRALYRAAEARAARLRLLIAAGRDLAAADPETLDATLASSARRAALFSGHGEGRVTLGEDGDGLPLVAPGPDRRRVGRLVLSGGPNAGAAVEAEDQEALSMLGQLMAAAIDRVAHESERERLLALLRERERRLEGVVERLFSAQEEERRRVSRDLHDGVAQTATALFRRLEAHGGAGLDAEAARAAAGLAQGLIREIRAAIADLRPMVLDDLGLTAAVGALGETLSRDGYDVSLSVRGPERWPTMLDTAFFRVAQEAISNVRKHAGGPCRVELSVFGDPEAGRWGLTVRDHGRGLPESLPDTANTGAGDSVGLAVMRERMTALGGALRIGAAAPRGVEVAALVTGVQ
jgi:signal transduction histidine kinase